MDKIKWQILLVAFIVSIVLFFGGAFIYEKHVIENTMESKLLEIEGIEEVQIKQKRNTVQVEVTGEFAEDFPGLVATTEEILKEYSIMNSSISFKDRRDGQLDEFADAAQPALHEAARLGNYWETRERIISMAGHHNPDEYYFTVDSNRIYLWARHGKNFMYVMIPLYSEEGDLEW